MDHNEGIADFSQCHAGIVRKLDQLVELPALIEAAERARESAQKSYEFFREAMFEHHLDEERELFTAVLEHAEEGEERSRVREMNRRLSGEHRQLEALWKRIEPGLKKVAKGLPAGDVDPRDVELFSRQYRAHALYEESDYLPLAQEILGRGEGNLAALGMALHMRHEPLQAFQFYI